MRKGELRARLSRALALLGLLACEPKSGPAARVPEPAPAPIAVEAASTSSEPPPTFLWQLQLGRATVHLLGSVHTARPELYPLDERIESAFESSEALVLELSLDEPAKLAAGTSMMEAARLPPGVKLKDVVKPATLERLEATLKSHGGSLLGLRGFRPWFVALALTEQALSREGFSADHGIDEHFRRRAVERRMPIAALETVEEQLGLFTGMSPETEELMLEQTLEELDQVGPQMNAAFELWQKGDAKGLDTLLLLPMRQEYPSLFARVFSERNRRMVERLSELAKDGRRHFVIVGAGHLVGGDGIVDLFGARGIVAKQL